MNCFWLNTDQVQVSSCLTYFYMSLCPLLKLSFTDISQNFLCLILIYWLEITLGPFWSAVVGIMSLGNLLGPVGDLYCFSNTFRMALLVFSGPVPKAQVHYSCPSFFHLSGTCHFWPVNRMWWNLTESKNSTSSTKFVFFQANRKTKMADQASDLLRHFRLLCNRWREFDEAQWEARTPMSSTKFVFWGLNWKERWLPWPPLAEISLLQLLNEIWWSLTGSSLELNVLYH